MRIVEPSFEILNAPKREEVLRHLELCGRVCYKSEDKMTEESASRFVKFLIERGHESPIEHISISVRVICDRGVSHEWVRHRIASYSQESTRYCNYNSEKFGGGIAFIRPYFADNERLFEIWKAEMECAEKAYMDMLANGAKPEDARSVLPNSLKTEFICTMNLREWRHFFELRCAKAAHPAMREIAVPLQEAFREMLPELF
ncbi:MAG: FAD-dependent thymidylate synthase [Clostridia bacterium]|nr:FAD-dependent thymidylate synthase [Clostridia bacterium]